MHSRNPREVSPPQTRRVPTTGPTTRPTAEEWHRAASVLPDTPLTSLPHSPRQQPSPPRAPQQPARSGPRLTRRGYWLAVLFITFFTLVLAGGLAQSQLTQIDGLIILVFLVMYLPVAVLRARGMGFSWWASAIMILVVGVLFFLVLFLWLGIAKSTTNSAQTHWKPKWNKIIIIGSIAIVATLVAASLLFTETNGSPRENNTTAVQGLAKCDAQLREQLLTASGATSEASTANTIITVIHAQRPDSCPPGAWNPVVNDVDNDHQGNVDIRFQTSSANVRGTPVTLPADGTPRWVYLAEKDQWYSAKISDPSVLAPSPDVIPRQQSKPAVTPQFRSLPTEPAEPVRIYLPTATSPPARTVPNPTPVTTELPIQRPTNTVAGLWTPPTSNQLQNVVPPTLKTTYTMGFATQTIIGQVKNTTGRRMGNIMADCQVYAGDVQVASATTLTNGLAPGAKWQYQADLFDDTLHGSDYIIECVFNEW